MRVFIRLAMGSEDSEDAMSKFEKLKQQYEEEGGFDDEETAESGADEASTTSESSDSTLSSDDQSDVREATGKETAFEPIEKDDNTDQKETTETGPSTVEVKTPTESQSSTTDRSNQVETKTPSASPTSTAEETSTSNSQSPTTTQRKQTATESGTSKTRTTEQSVKRQQTSRPPAQQQPPQNAGRPYLSSMPENYDDEQRIIEWIGELVEIGGRSEAQKALAYYRSIGWISDSVEDELREYLEMFADHADGRPLTMDDHARSLEYIAQLSGSRIVRSA